MNSGIYVIECISNKRKYVGSSKNLIQRFSMHKYHLKRKTHYNKILQRCYNKYGIENFKFTILEYVINREKLIEREQYWIDYYGFKNLMNMKDKAGATHKVNYEKVDFIKQHKIEFLKFIESCKYQLEILQNF